MPKVGDFVSVLEWDDQGNYFRWEGEVTDLYMPSLLVFVDTGGEGAYWVKLGNIIEH